MHVHLMHPPVMKLEEWMQNNSVSDADLAGRVGRDRTIISKLRKGQIKPSIKVLLAITRLTDGQVTIEDFMPEQSPDEAAA